MHATDWRWVAAILISLAGCRTKEPRVDPSIGRTFPPIVVPAEAEGQTYEHVFVFGDWGTGTAGQEAVAAAMVLRARTYPIDFMLTTGDNFYVDGVDSVDDSKWERFEEVYDHRSLRVPVYATLGNHDHLGDPDAQVAYGRKNPRWVMPARHYDFTRTLADGTVFHYFALDSTPIHSGWWGHAEQLKWLEDALARSTARWKIVFGHHPMYTNSGRENDQAMLAALEPLFTRHRVDVYFAGHDHILELLQPVKGVQYVISGGGGGPEGMGRVTWRENTVYAASGGGFVAMRAGRDELVLEFVRTDGRTQFLHVVQKAPVEAEAPGAGQ